MKFFFVRDHRGKYRYFSSEASLVVPKRLSKSLQAWELAKKKLMVLPLRILRQEQAFERTLFRRGQPLSIHYAGSTDEAAIREAFLSFLKKQRAGHILILIGEAVLVPITGLAAILPGPNVLFYALALLMITQWLGLRGIQRTLRSAHALIPDETLAAWEDVVRAGRKDLYGQALSRIGNRHGVHHVDKILWKALGSRGDKSRRRPEP
jgi:hypothetical protein